MSQGKCLAIALAPWYIDDINEGATRPLTTKGNRIMSNTLTPKELAARFDTDARTVRKFLRSTEGMDAKVGKGQRWAIEAKQVRSLKARFNRWDAARKATDAPADAEAPAEGDDA